MYGCSLINMGEKLNKLSSNTWVPLGAVFLFIVSIASVIWMAAAVSTRVEAMEEKESPTRYEFESMQSDISEIKTDVKTLIKQQ